jgi:hypothetical protein
LEFRHPSTGERFFNWIVTRDNTSPARGKPSIFVEGGLKRMTSQFSLMGHSALCALEML